jgi:hypothetical protein
VAEPVRVVAVLGYSARRDDGLHPLCALRLRHAEELAAGVRAVVLSGWARRRGGRAEAELMYADWSGPLVPLVCDTTARTTAGNAASVAAASRELGADEVVVVTSRWHRLRAATLVRTALRGSGIAVRTSSPRGGQSLALLAREVACLLTLPAQLLLLRRTDGLTDS